MKHSFDGAQLHISVLHLKCNILLFYKSKQTQTHLFYDLKLQSYPVNCVSSKPQTFNSPILFSSSKADTSVNHIIPSAGQGMMTLLFATFSMMVSPGSAKDGASVRTEKHGKCWFNVQWLLIQRSIKSVKSII